MLARADLPQLTGHTEPADIEIRSLWVDDHDDLVFAGSSWAPQRLDVPAFFVLELTHPQAAGE